MDMMINFFGVLFLMHAIMPRRSREFMVGQPNAKQSGKA